MLLSQLSHEPLGTGAPGASASVLPSASVLVPCCSAGCETGEVKVWNFSSGQCLCTLHPRSRSEVTAIVAVRQALLKQFLVGGWDRKVTYYEDPGGNSKDALPGRMIQGHKVRVRVRV